jgi:hypothetical protein
VENAQTSFRPGDNTPRPAQKTQSQQVLLPPPNAELGRRAAKQYRR